MDFISHLPQELTLRICCFLDFRSLESVSCVSRAARILLNDEIAWKNAFLEYYGPFSHFGSIDRTWKSEFRARTALLRRYERSRGNIIVYDGRIGTITQTAIDWSNASLIVANLSNGLISVSDTTTGRVAKNLIFPSSAHLTSSDITTICLANDRIIYGLVNGSIAINHLDRSKQSLEFRVMTDWHEGPVTCICAKVSQGAQDHAIDFITSGVDGCVKFWNIQDRGSCFASIDVSSTGIRKMWWNSATSSSLYLLSCTEEVYSIILPAGRTASDIAQCGITQLKSATDSALFSSERWADMVCDVSSNAIIVANNTSLVKYSLKNGVACPESFAWHFDGKIIQLAIDQHDVQRDVLRPGLGGRCMAVASDQGLIAVYDCREASDPPRFVLNNGCNITALCINSVVVAVGCDDGRVLLYNALDLTPLRQLATRIAKYEQIIREDANRTKVLCIELDHNHPRGLITTGGLIRSFNYDPRFKLSNGKRIGRGRMKGFVRNVSGSSASTIREEIRSGLSEMAYDDQLTEGRKDKYFALSGPLAEEMTDSELLSYGKLLSMEADQRAGDDFEDNEVVPAATRARSELQEALLLSMQPEYSSVNHASTKGTSGSAKDAMSSQEEYDLALALSMSIM